MKKSLISFVLMSLVGMTLTSCNIYSPFLSKSNSSEDSSYTPFTRPETSDAYYKVDPASFRPYSLQDINNSYGTDAVPSTGNVKLLVLPIEFSDYVFSSSFLTNLNTALVGNNDDGSTGYWESLSSYYKKSSFGKLNLSFEIASIYKPNMTAYDAYSKWGSSSSSSDNGSTLIEAALSKYSSSHSTKDFDSDGNGYIDGVIAVYSCPNYTTGNLNFQDKTGYYWAYTFWADNDPNPLNPTLSSYFWLSQDFLVNQHGVDAHTLIHEFGHMMGLDDYYPNGTSFNPTGGLLMMDANVLDHDSYSKSILGWMDPIVVDDDCTIDIGPANSTGDCIIVPTSKFNGSVYDEYLLIELYTPNLLNELDSKTAYSSVGKGYSIPGIKIYHIDSRVMELTVNGVTNYSVNAEYYDKPVLKPNGRTFYKIGATNCQKKASYANTSFSLIHLLESSGIFTFKRGGYGNDLTLFRSHSVFDISKFKSFFPNGTKYNNGEYVNVEIDVNEVNSSKANLTFRFV